MSSSWLFRPAAAAVCCVLFVAAGVRARTQEPFQPEVGQAGKDVVWVPTPPELVEQMLDLANVTSDDFVIDLGSGDGRNVIAAAKRGARALGVEYNSKMVQLSRQRAAAASVADKAKFVEGDMYEADISKASVLALFLLPSNMMQLTPKFLDMRPGSRIVSNTFGIEGWEPDESARIENGCSAWCNALLWIVPAKVAGQWRLGKDALVLTQRFQMLSGTLNGEQIGRGRMRGKEIRFTVGSAEYHGRVDGTRMEGTVRAGSSSTKWVATRN